MDNTQHKVTGTITWFEDRSSGRGYYHLKWDDGSSEDVQWDAPIDASTDSREVVEMFSIPYSNIDVDHDGEYIHVTAST